MRENHDSKRAVSDDFWILNETFEEGARAKTSSEGALFGSTLEEAGLDAASDNPGTQMGTGTKDIPIREQLRDNPRNEK